MKTQPNPTFCAPDARRSAVRRGRSLGGSICSVAFLAFVALHAPAISPAQSPSRTVHRGSHFIIYRVEIYGTRRIRSPLLELLVTNVDSNGYCGIVLDDSDTLENEFIARRRGDRAEIVVLKYSSKQAGFKPATQYEFAGDIFAPDTLQEPRDAVVNPLSERYLDHWRIVWNRQRPSDPSEPNQVEFLRPVSETDLDRLLQRRSAAIETAQTEWKRVEGELSQLGSDGIDVYLGSPRKDGTFRIWWHDSEDDRDYRAVFKRISETGLPVSIRISHSTSPDELEALSLLTHAVEVEIRIPSTDYRVRDELEALKDVKTLERLVLSGPMTDAPRSLGRLEQLKELVLSFQNNRVVNRYRLHFAFLLSMDSLERFELEDYGRRTAGDALLYLRKCKNLQSVTIRAADFSPDQIRAIGDMPSLKYLALDEVRPPLLTLITNPALQEVRIDLKRVNIRGVIPMISVDELAKWKYPPEAHLYVNNHDIWMPRSFTHFVRDLPHMTAAEIKLYSDIATFNEIVDDYMSHLRNWTRNFRLREWEARIRAARAVKSDCQSMADQLRRRLAALVEANLIGRENALAVQSALYPYCGRTIRALRKEIDEKLWETMRNDRQAWKDRLVRAIHD